MPDDREALEAHDPELDDDELVPEDDRIIGTALRWSLGVLAAILLVGGAGYLLLFHRAPAAPPERVIEAQAPVAVEASVEPPALPFTDVTGSAGIDFVHFNGARGEKLLPETMGGGAAFFDVDDDGDPDLLLTNGAPWPGAPPPARRPTPHLYVNDGSGRFRDVTASAGLAVSFYGTGVAVGDYDGDGRRDLYLTALGKNHLFHNRGGRFEEVTDAAGVAGGDRDWSTSAGFFDADRDGDLDLFVCNYVRWSQDIDRRLDYRLTGVGRAYGPPVNYEGAFPVLFRNDGDGTFTDVSEAAGLHVVNPATGVPVSKALAIAVVDVDGDGWLDVLVANDTVRNFLFRNRGDGTFEEVGELYGVAYDRGGQATGAMGVDAAHYRNDRELGFAIGNFANEMTSLYISQGEPTLFADESIGDGIGAPSRTLLSFGMFFFDVDLDGRLDILEANGHLENEIATVDPSQSYEQPAQLFWNAGADAPRTFVEVPPEKTGDLARPAVGRGSAFADIDGDGDLDVVVTQAGRRPLLLRNDQTLGHHWLRLRLVDRRGDRDAIGAAVEVTAGGQLQRRLVMPTRSYLSQSEPVVTFGLGEATQVDAVRVVWPDGTAQEVGALPVDRLQVIERQ